MYNFDEHIDRRGTHSVKWDGLNEHYGSTDLLSMWVADSDFKCPDVIVNRLIDRAKHGVFGYTACEEPFHKAFINWMQKRHNFQVQSDWLSTTPGIVAAMNFAINALTEPGDKIIIQSPVYPPFFNSVNNNGRRLVENPLIEKNQTYEMDFDNFERCIDDQTKMLILCNPHNPIGRVWRREELEKLGELCIKHDLIVLSDEIHSDLILKGHKHVPFANLSEALRNRTIACYAPSKTFNVAGLSSSIAVIPNDDIREKFNLFKRNIGVHNPTVFGIEAFTACYEEGEPWLEEQMTYIKANIDYVNDYLAKHIPKIKAFDIEGTYLLWLDCRQLNLPQEALKQFFIEDVKVALNSGDLFGNAGTGFMRVNMATTKARVEQFLTQLKKAYDQL